MAGLEGVSIEDLNRIDRFGSQPTHNRFEQVY